MQKMPISRICDFISRHPLAVISSISPSGDPQSALVGIAVTDKLEIIFDTLTTSRKYRNICQNPNVALVIGWEDETTIQYEGTAIELGGAGAEEYREIYYKVFPGGRQRAVSWPGLVHIKVSPRWLRYSNFNEPQVVEEMTF